MVVFKCYGLNKISSKNSSFASGLTYTVEKSDEDCFERCSQLSSKGSVYISNVTYVLLIYIHCMHIPM